MKIYLDNCALGRLTDQQDQPRLVAEHIAVRECLARVQVGALCWTASAALVAEIANSSNVVRRAYTASLLELATEVQPYTSAVYAEAERLQPFGFASFDAQHLAFALAAGADVLLTTDDRFVRAAQRLVSVPAFAGRRVTEVLNPVDWLRRITP